MKINGSKPPEGQEVNLNVKKVTAKSLGVKSAEQAKVQADKVEISLKGRELSELVKAAKELPDIRSDRVDSIKEAIAKGNYNIDPVKIAEKILMEI